MRLWHPPPLYVFGSFPKERIKRRANPTFKSLEEFKMIRTSCWILEERDGNFFCDCYKGMKGKQCKHEVGMMYKKGILEVTSEVRSVPINQQRKRGRPKKLPHCLSRSPVSLPSLRPTSPASSSPSLTSTNLFDIEAQPNVQITTRKRKRLPGIPVAVAGMSPLASLKPGLGASKPPKKKARNEPNEKILEKLTKINHEG